MSTHPTREVNLDGLVGPTHNYAGLAPGNVASRQHRDEASNPKQAALQGLAKTKMLHDLGVTQLMIPPQQRPHLDTLRRLGFTGDDPEIINQTHRHAPHLLAAVYSASSMWTANAATVSPSPDTRDTRAHFTPANLTSTLHRAIEPPETSAVLRKIFDDDSVFTHHPPLPPSSQLRDEGAANHTRLCRDHDQPGLEIFVYGSSAGVCGVTSNEITDETIASGDGGVGTIQREPQPRVYPARQTLEASRAVARHHGLDPRRTLFIQQSPRAIDTGVFHNDVISVGNRNVWIYHSQAFVDTPSVTDRITQAYHRITDGDDLIRIEVTPDELSLPSAVETYLFNSQLVSLPDGGMVIICPMRCYHHPAAKQVLDRIIADKDNPIRSVKYVQLHQSMRNGGGPGCLRLRVVLTDDQLARTHQGVLLTDTLHTQLTQWVQKHYRDQLTPNDLADLKLLEETRAALDELMGILRLGPLYPFQQ